MSDEFAVGRVVGGFDPLDMNFHRGVNALDMFHQFVLLVGGPDDENGAGVGDGSRHLLEKGLILLLAPVGAFVAVFKVAHRPLGMDDDFIRVVRVEVEDARHPVVDPDDRVIMMFHEALPIVVRSSSLAYATRTGVDLGHFAGRRAGFRSPPCWDIGPTCTIRSPISSFSPTPDRRPLRNTLDVAAIGCPVLPGFRARPSRVRPTT